MTNTDRILIIKLGALGDVILALPHIRRIVAAHPDAAITVLTAPEYADLLAGEAGISVAAFRRRGFLEMSRLLAWLRRVKGDRAYLLADENVRVTVNKQFAEPFTRLDPGDEVAIVPNSPNPPPPPQRPKQRQDDW